MHADYANYGKESISNTFTYHKLRLGSVAKKNVLLVRKAYKFCFRYFHRLLSLTTCSKCAARACPGKATDQNHPPASSPTSPPLSSLSSLSSLSFLSSLFSLSHTNIGEHDVISTFDLAPSQFRDGLAI